MRKIALGLLTFTSLHAALPPLAQSAREIKEIVADPTLYKKLGGAEGIEKILKVDGGYQVCTRNQSLLVRVTYLHSQQPGPAKFSLEFSESMLLAPEQREDAYEPIGQCLNGDCGQD